MPSPDDMKNRRVFNDAFLAGEKIRGIRFRHNSHVAFTSADGVRRDGWIVSVARVDPEPVYTIERSDGRGDVEVLESKIDIIADPHEAP